MVNVNKLKGKIIERGLKIEQVAKMLGITSSTLYRKFKMQGESITIREAKTLSIILELTPKEVNSIFFDNFVAWNATTQHEVQKWSY